MLTDAMLKWTSKADCAMLTRLKENSTDLSYNIVTVRDAVRIMENLKG